MTPFIICISNKAKYLDKEHSYPNSAKEVILGFQMVFLIQKKILVKIWCHRLSCYFQNTTLGKIVFEGDPIEFHDPNQRNLMAEVSTEVSQTKLMSTFSICNFYYRFKLLSHDALSNYFLHFNLICIFDFRSL